MITKKTISLFLCFALILSALFACAAPDEDDVKKIEDEPVIELPEPEPPVIDTPIEEFPTGSIDFETAITAFPRDTVMIRAGDLTITWAELYVFLFRDVQEFAQYSYEGIDWEEEVSGITLAEIILTYSSERAVTFLLFEYGMTALDLTISDEDMLEHTEFIDEMIEVYGGKEELSLALRESNGFYDFDVFERLLFIEFTRDLILKELYGDGGDLLDEEKIVEYAEDNEFMMAKHILIASEDNDSALEETEDILEQLRGKINDKDFSDFFDSMMEEFSEDPGKASSPEGYLFQFNDMVPEFSEASVELEIGELSEIVKTDYGYHIILRIPVNFDSVPISAAFTGDSRTLRQRATIDDFEKLMFEWHEELNPEFTREHESIDIATIFKWQEDQ